jgi:hypothetical protein
MSQPWPMVPLGEVLSHYREYIEALEPRPYPKLSVKLYGKGVVLDAPTDGSTLWRYLSQRNVSKKSKLK